jgi:hypothetical protein
MFVLQLIDINPRIHLQKNRTAKFLTSFNLKITDGQLNLID